MRNFSVVDKYLSLEPDPAFARRAEIVFKNLKNIKRGAKVLDFGCGRGFYLKTLSDAFGDLNLYGVDLNQKYLKIARKNIKNPKVKIEVGDVQRLPYKNNFFDVIIASEILEHVENDVQAIKEVHRVLKPGGFAMVTVPNKNYPFLWDPLNWFLERFFNTHIPSNIWWLAGIWADHNRLYTKEDLLSKFKKRGFKIESAWLSTHYCFPFSHFIYYGIGKNLVENGLFSSLNRFEIKSETSVINRLLLWPVRFVDSFNGGKLNSNTSVNIILKVVKR